jgi:hypothetical protein
MYVTQSYLSNHVYRYNSVTLSTLLCNYHQHSSPEHFHHIKLKLCTIKE